jgi:ketosteroid isomerase-like protein
MPATDEIRATLHAYCRLLDERRLDDLVVRVYAPDAVDDRRRGTPLRGRAEIRAYFARAAGHLRATAHLITNVDVTLTDADHAAATSRVLAFHWTPESADDPLAPADFVLLGSYDDELVRTAEGWRIARRVVGALGPAGLAAGRLPEVFAGFGGRGTAVTPS